MKIFQNNMIERIKYDGFLPDSFFEIFAKIFHTNDSKTVEDKEAIISLFNLEQNRNEIYIYTDHENIRLVGIFPIDEEFAYFGFWETTNNNNLNQKAFEMLEDDVKQKSRKSIIGPINFNTYHAYRLRLSKPSWGSFDREPENPDYYPTILEKYGFENTMNFESRMIKSENIKDVYIEKEALLSEISKIPFNFIPLNPSVWKEYEVQIFELIQSIFKENPFFVSISFEQFKLYYNQSFAEKLCPYSSVIFQDKATGELASISICHPNYSPLSIEKPVFESDFIKLKKKVLLAKTVGVHPNYRKRGLMNFMGAYGMLSFNKYYDEIIFCLMRSDNHSLHFTDYVKYERVHYAIFKKKLGS